MTRACMSCLVLVSALVTLSACATERAYLYEDEFEAVNDAITEHVADAFEESRGERPPPERMLYSKRLGDLTFIVALESMRASLYPMREQEHREVDQAFQRTFERLGDYARYPGTASEDGFVDRPDGEPIEALVARLGETIKRHTR